MLHYGLLQALRDRRRTQDDTEVPDDLHEEPASHVSKDGGGEFAYALRRKRTAGLLKHMLTDAGYGDLAKMAAIRREKKGDQENVY